MTISIELLKKILSSPNDNEMKFNKINEIIDKKIFDIFSKLSFIDFKIKDVRKLKNIKDKINNYALEEKYQNTNLYIKNLNVNDVKNEMYNFKAIPVIYKYDSDIKVMDLNNNYINLEKEEILELLEFEKAYPEFLNSIVKCIILPHKNIEYSFINFITNSYLDKNLIIDFEYEKLVNDIENKKLNRKEKYIKEFNTILDKYKMYIENQINEYKKTGLNAKRFNLNLIKESIDDKYEQLEEELSNLKQLFKTKKLEDYLIMIDDLKKEFEKEINLLNKI